MVMKHAYNSRFLRLGFAIVLLTALTSCRQETSSAWKSSSESALHQQLPRALFITTGLPDGNGLLPKGIVIALQALNQKGVVCRLETREILYRREELFEYNILVLSTSLGYHDADRTYSLAFMADEELSTISDFVASGGVLIAGDNVGRNYPDGTDRISVFRRLTPENFPLANCLGGTLEERYMEDHHIELEMGDYFSGTFREKPAMSKWALVMDSVFSDSINTIGNWILNEDTLPAVTQNRYGKGTAYLLATSDFLEPVDAGGEFSSRQITDFYHFIIEDFQRKNDQPLNLNPWPAGYQQAFCITLNANGKREQYRRIFEYLEQEDLEPVVFTSGILDKPVEELLIQSGVNLQSSGFGYQRYASLSYADALLDIMKNQAHWQRDFSGFRFPFTSPSHWGLMILDKNEALYESSIGANNLNFFHGSVVPYNLVLASGSYFTTTDIMEVAPVYHDDFHFYQAILEERQPNPVTVQKSVKLYEDYLLNYWELAVKPHQGAMVYLGHPAYLGKSDTTLIPLQSLVSKAKEDHTWLTTIDEIARFRHALSRFRFFVESNGNRYTLRVEGPPDLTLEKLCVRVPWVIKKSAAKIGNIEINTKGQYDEVIFTAVAGQVLQITQ
jgi:hypothetical protein